MSFKYNLEKIRKNYTFQWKIILEGHTVKIIKGFECRELKVQTCPLLVSNVYLFSLWIHRYLARLAKGQKKTCTAGYEEYCHKQVTKITGCSPCSKATPLLSERSVTVKGQNGYQLPSDPSHSVSPNPERQHGQPSQNSV